MPILIIVGLCLLGVAVILYVVVTIKGVRNVRNAQQAMNSSFERYTHGSPVSPVNGNAFDKVFSNQLSLVGLGLLALVLGLAGVGCIAAHFIMKYM